MFAQGLPKPSLNAHQAISAGRRPAKWKPDPRLRLLSLNLWTLALRDIHIDSESLCNLVHLFPKLLSFGYTHIAALFGLWSGQEWEFEHVDVIKQLQETSPDVQELVLRNQYIEDYGAEMWDVYQHLRRIIVPTWLPHKELDTLIMPTEYLLGWAVSAMKFFDGVGTPGFDISTISSEPLNPKT